MLLVLFRFFRSSHRHQTLELDVVRHQIGECIYSLDLTLFDPYDSIASIENVELMCGQNAALVLKKASDGIVENMSSHVGILQR